MTRLRQRLLAWTLVSALSLYTTTTTASVLAIDYGTDFIKASLMKPGVAFDVLLNRDSKRKIAASIAWKGDERLFGTDAVNIAARFPSESFSGLKLLQGVSFGSPQAERHATLYPQLDVAESDRNTLNFKRKDGSIWSNEELIAMQLANVKHLAEAVAAENVRDAIITVPAYYSQFERQAVLDSLELAGLRGISLVNDGTAIAVNFAMSRSFPEKEYHIIYDAGSSGIRATLASFHTVPGDSALSVLKSKTGDPTHVGIKGFGYDRQASGAEMDYRLRNILKEAFETKHDRGRAINKEMRAIAKLNKEANRVKTILSANIESNVMIESFVWDIDFRTKVTRNDFEDACADLKPRFVRPILDALTQAGLTMSDVTSVILTGGVSRVPMVQNAVKALVGESKVAFNVNADEAAVLGAAFYGASLSRQFRTKEIKVEDFLAHDIQVSYAAESKVTTRVINTSIFPTGSKHGAKKTLTFKRKDDFNVTLVYKNVETKGTPLKIIEAELIGVQEAITSLTEAGAKEPVVKLTVGISDSGFATLEDAIAFGDIKDDSIAGKLKNIFGAGSSSSSESEGSETTTSSSADVTATAKPPSVKDTIPLILRTHYLTLLPLSGPEKAVARQRLVALDDNESTRRRKEEAYNMLEGYLYRLRDYLDGEPTSPFKLYSKAEERKSLERKLEEALAWLNERGEDADTGELWAQREALEALEKPIQFRYKENEDAPRELDSLQQALAAGDFFLKSARENRTLEAAADLPHKYTLEELDAVEKRLNGTIEWLKAGMETQKKLKKHDDPVLISAEMKARGVTLQNQVMKLLKRKNPKPVKKTTTSTTATEAEATGSATAEETRTPAHPEL